MIREGEHFVNTALYQMEQKRKAEEDQVKGKKQGRRVISSEEMDAQHA